MASPRQSNTPATAARVTTPTTSALSRATGTSSTLSPTNNNPTPTTSASPLINPTTSPSLDSITPDRSNSTPVIVTQSSIVPSPQTIPIDPDDPDAGSSSDDSSPSSNNPRALPVVAIVIISVVCGLIGLVIIYRIYRRLYSRWQRHYLASRDDSTLPPPPPPSLDPSPASRLMIPGTTGSQSRLRPMSQYYQAASSTARNSAYHPSYQYLGGTASEAGSLGKVPLATAPSYQYLGANVSEAGSLGKLPLTHALVDPEKYDNHSLHSSVLQINDDSHSSSPIIGGLHQRDSILSGSEHLSSDDSRPMHLNPLLSTRDHSTLSTDTLRQASRRGSSMLPNSHLHPSQYNRHSVYDFGLSNAHSPSPDPRSSRLSPGLPHLAKSRLELTLPSPLAPPQGLVNLSSAADESGATRLQFSHQSGIGDHSHQSSPLDLLKLQLAHQH